MAGDFTTVEVDGRQVRISNPAKVFFSARDETKLDLVHHYLTVGPGVLRGVWCRPTVLHRFPDGAEGKSFYQKRVPESRPEWLETALEDRAGSLAPLLALARQAAAQGVADAPWPPHHPRRS